MANAKTGTFRTSTKRPTAGRDSRGGVRISSNMIHELKALDSLPQTEGWHNNLEDCCCYILRSVMIISLHGWQVG